MINIRSKQDATDVKHIVTKVKLRKIYKDNHFPQMSNVIISQKQIGSSRHEAGIWGGKLGLFDLREIVHFVYFLQ